MGQFLVLSDYIRLTNIEGIIVLVHVLFLPCIIGILTRFDWSEVISRFNARNS